MLWVVLDRALRTQDYEIDHFTNGSEQRRRSLANKPASRRMSRMICDTVPAVVVDLQHGNLIVQMRAELNSVCLPIARTKFLAWQDN